MLGLVIDSLVKAFPNSKFILTIRRPLSWVESEINQEDHLGHIEPFGTAKEYMFETNGLKKYDLKLIEEGFYSLSGYLSYWAHHNKKVLKAVPPSKLLIIRTEEITPNIDKVANFVGCSVMRSKTHEYKRSKKRYILKEMVNPQHLRHAVEKYTSDVQEEIDKALSKGF